MEMHEELPSFHERMESERREEEEMRVYEVNDTGCPWIPFYPLTFNRETTKIVRVSLLETVHSFHQSHYRSHAIIWSNIFIFSHSLSVHESRPENTVVCEQILSQSLHSSHFTRERKRKDVVSNRIHLNRRH